MEIEVVNLKEKLGSFTEHWSPKIIGELNNQLVKIAKFKDEFIMHQHENEDELFLVIKGKLLMELEDKTLEIHPGELVIIPRKTPHFPKAIGEAHVLLFEPKSTVNTGNVENERTLTDLDKI